MTAPVATHAVRTEAPQAGARALVRSRLAGLAFIGVTAITAPIAYTYMFFGFRPYDDEGYMLLTLRDYLGGKPVVTPYLQLYGPFYYEVMGGVYRALGIEPGHDNGRLITLAVWLLAGVLGGIAGYRLTRSMWLGIGAQLVTLSVLTPLSSEPMTTYGLISLLLISLVVAATFRQERPRASAAAIGGLVAALCLVKINVGVFAAVAVALAWVGSLSPPWRRSLAVPAIVLGIALPFGLMAGRLHVEWVFEFAIVVSLSAAAIGVVQVMVAPRPVPPPSGWWLVLGGLVVGAACIFIALPGGTRLDDLWNSLVVVPIRFPGTFVVPVPIDGGIVVWAALCFIGAIVLTRRMGRAGPASTGLLRAWAGVLIWLVVLRQPSSFFLLALPLCWIAAQPPVRDRHDPAGAYCRMFVPALAVIWVLQAYPVAGTQLALSALGLVPVGAIILGDGIRELRLAGERWPTSAVLARWTAPAVLAACVVAFVVFGLVSTMEFRAGVPLDLPGSSVLRVPAAQAAQLRPLVSAIDSQCSSFITYPGMDSFYIWTAQNPPSDMRYGLWWLSLDDPQQRSIVQQLADKPRLCVVKNQSVNAFWAEDRPIPLRPLVVFIDQNFVESGTYGDYELLVRAG